MAKPKKPSVKSVRLGQTIFRISDRAMEESPGDLYVSQVLVVNKVDEGISGYITKRRLINWIKVHGVSDLFYSRGRCQTEINKRIDGASDLLRVSMGCRKS